MENLSNRPAVAFLRHTWCGGSCPQRGSVAESMRDPSWRLPAWADRRQFSECLHLANSGGQIHCAARVELSQVREADRALRQHSRLELADPRRQVPQLQSQDFDDVPGRGIAHGNSVPFPLSGFWTDE